MAGDFLDGLQVERSALFTGWLTAQRRQFRGAHAALLEHLATTLPDVQALPYIETWLQLAPFDLHAHQSLLNALAQLGRIQDGERHLASAVTRLEAEGCRRRACRRRGRRHAQRRRCRRLQAWRWS
jgi:DNA-binding SARP family transcriptional activator